MWVEGKSLYALDLAKQKPYQFEGSTSGMTNKTGPGDVPDGWSVKTWIADHRAKGFADDVGGGIAIGMKPVAGNAILFSPEIDFGEAKFVRLAFEYRSNSSERLCTVRFREMNTTKTENANLAPGAGWTKFERVYDVSDFKSAIRIEFHDSDRTGEFRLKSFKLIAVERKS
jgi:hypothetical protein